MRRISTTAFRIARRGTFREINRQIALNLLPHVPASEHGRALAQALSFLAGDTRGGPFFPLAPLDGDGAEPVDAEQLGRWYRRFVDTRSAQSASPAPAASCCDVCDSPELAAA